MRALIVDGDNETRREAIAITHVGRKGNLSLTWSEATNDGDGRRLCEEQTPPDIVLISSRNVRVVYPARRVTRHVLVIAHEELSVDDDVELLDLGVHIVRRPRPLRPYAEVMALSAVRGSERRMRPTPNALSDIATLLRRLDMDFPDALDAAATQGTMDAVCENDGNKTHAGTALGTDRRWIDRHLPGPDVKKIGPTEVTVTKLRGRGGA